MLAWFCFFFALFSIHLFLLVFIHFENHIMDPLNYLFASFFDHFGVLCGTFQTIDNESILMMAMLIKWKLINFVKAFHIYLFFFSFFYLTKHVCVYMNLIINGMSSMLRLMVYFYFWLQQNQMLSAIYF